MRPLADTDVVPVVVRIDKDDFVTQHREATDEKLAAVQTEDDGAVVTTIIVKEKGPEVVTCPRKHVLFDDQHGTGFYYLKQQILLFALDHEDATRYASIQRDYYASPASDEQKSRVKTAHELTTSVQSSAQTAFETGTGSEKDAKVAMHALLDQWANCGNTSENLRQLLVSACGLHETRRRTGIRTGDDFNQAYSAALTWTEPLFIDVSLLNIHTFSLELHTDGGYLVQGYQGAYTAFWWQGITEVELPLKVPGMKTDEHVVPHDWAKYQDKMIRLRNEWGNNQKLHPDQITSLLSSIVNLIGLGRDGDWTPAAHELFITLPFYIGQSPDATVGSSPGALTTKPPGPISLDINVRGFDDFVAGYAKFDGTGGSLCHLALRQLAEKMTKLSSSFI
jgi:hypothetical protein